MKGFSAEGFRKDSGRIPEGSGPSALPFSIQKVSCGRFRGRFLRKVPQKVFAEGSAEGSCGRFRGRFLRKVFVKGLSAEGFRKDSGRFWTFGPALKSCLLVSSLWY